MPVDATRLTFESMYAAITGRDHRYDGVFYTAVHSTRIYCRPSCPARKPLPENVTFYPSAAAAQSAGFRACLRCVPEALPGSPLWDVPSSIVSRAMELINDGVVDDDGVGGLARRLGWSTRSISRLVVEQTGAPPLAHARARRARVAHALITRTDQPFADIAFASGFSSIRQFNQTVQEVYGRTPSELRRHRRGTDTASGVLRARLQYEPPFDLAGLAGFYRDSTSDPEASDQIQLELPDGAGTACITNDVDGRAVVAHIRLRDISAYRSACIAIRRMLDLDADSAAIDQHLAADPRFTALVAKRSGVRIPGTATPEEALQQAFDLFDTDDVVPSESRTRAVEYLRSVDVENVPPSVARHVLDDLDLPAAVVAYTLIRGFRAPDVDLAGAIHGSAPGRPCATSPWSSYASMHLIHDGQLLNRKAQHA